MKKLILSIFTILLLVNVFAQNVDRRRPASLGVSFFKNDFVTAPEINRGGLANVLKNHHLFAKGRMNAGVALNYLKGLSNHIDFAAALGGSFVTYPIPNKPPSSNKFLLETTGSLNFKLLPDNFVVVPYADLGIGISSYSGHYAAFAPVGAGLQINLHDETFLSFNSQYRIPVTEMAAPHLYYSFTIYGVIGKKK